MRLELARVMQWQLTSIPGWAVKAIPVKVCKLDRIGDLRKIGRLSSMECCDRVAKKLFPVLASSTDSIQLFVAPHFSRNYHSRHGRVKTRWHPIFDSRNSFLA